MNTKQEQAYIDKAQAKGGDVRGEGAQKQVDQSKREIAHMAERLGENSPRVAQAERSHAQDMGGTPAYRFSHDGEGGAAAPGGDNPARPWRPSVTKAAAPASGNRFTNTPWHTNPSSGRPD